MQASRSRLFPPFFRTTLFGIVWLCLGTLSSPAEAALPQTLTLTASEYSETLSVQEMSGWFRLATAPARSLRERSEIENTVFCPTKETFCQFSLSRQGRIRTKVSYTDDIDTDVLHRFVETLATRIDQDPTDAKFSIEDTRVVVSAPEKVGRKLKTDESYAAVLSALRRAAPKEKLTLSLPTDVAFPAITSADKDRLGLVELVGEGRSNFKGSPKNRIYNIKRALEQFDGVLIAPGEEFSFVDHLGEVDGEHGYLPELVIKNNQTTPEFGGGICQVSSTVFRAAIYSGLKVTERRNHAYPVRYYYPYGMDATIYIPKPDLSFTNNTPGHILMKPFVEGTELTFRFYGTKDGRSVNVDGPHILQSNPDGSMRTVFTQEVNDASGQNFIRDSFWSNYKSPSLYPHPGEERVLTSKPADWSERQWREYKKIH